MKRQDLVPAASPSVACSVDPELSPVRPPRGYLVVPSQRGDLLCDPLTGLVAYPSFESHVIAELPTLARRGFHVAIGDVDDLRSYVSEFHEEDPSHFGHLAGNECMRLVGEATRRWADEYMTTWPSLICATFGGDEVIVVAAGREYAAFLDALSQLIACIREAAPRACSFAAATVMPTLRPLVEPREVYRRLIARVDHCLFHHKAVARASSERLNGFLANCGLTRLTESERPAPKHASRRRIPR